MIKIPGYYWAYDDEERPQIVQILGNGTCLVMGVADPVRENSFVCILTPAIEIVPFSDYEDCDDCALQELGCGADGLCGLYAPPDKDQDSLPTAADVRGIMTPPNKSAHCCDGCKTKTACIENQKCAREERMEQASEGSDT